MKTKLSNWGNSQGIRIPVSILRKMKISDSGVQEVELTVNEKGTLEVKKASKKIQYADYFKGFDIEEWEKEKELTGGFENRLSYPVGNEHL